MKDCSVERGEFLSRLSFSRVLSLRTLSPNSLVCLVSSRLEKQTPGPDSSGSDLDSCDCEQHPTATNRLRNSSVAIYRRSCSQVSSSAGPSNQTKPNHPPITLTSSGPLSSSSTNDCRPLHPRHHLHIPLTSSNLRASFRDIAITWRRLPSCSALTIYSSLFFPFPAISDLALRTVLLLPDMPTGIRPNPHTQTTTA